MKAAEDFWRAAAKMWPLPFAAFPASAGVAGEQVPKSQEDFWKSMQEFWQSYASIIGGTQKREGERGGKADVIPSFIADPYKALWDGFTMLQKQWMDARDQTAQPVHGEEMGQAFQNVSRSVFEMYGEEFRKVLNLPQLGLTRFYQERANLAVEKYSRFQSAIHEFLMILLKPMGQS